MYRKRAESEAPGATSPSRAAKVAHPDCSSECGIDSRTGNSAGKCQRSEVIDRRPTVVKETVLGSRREAGRLIALLRHDRHSAGDEGQDGSRQRRIERRKEDYLAQ